jgi:hypothetical protein
MEGNDEKKRGGENKEDEVLRFIAVAVDVDSVVAAVVVDVDARVCMEDVVTSSEGAALFTIEKDANKTTQSSVLCISKTDMGRV